MGKMSREKSFKKSGGYKINPAQLTIERGLSVDRKQHYPFLLLDAFNGLSFAFVPFDAAET